MTTPIRPDHVYALVVGIEKYQAGSHYDLPGPAHDALQFSQWLLDWGVKPEHIYLFLSPLEQNEWVIPVAASRGLEPKPATHELIANTIRSQFTDENSRGDLLYIFWGGHGIVTKTTATTRRLLFADTDDQTKWNLNVNSLVDALSTAAHGSGFSQQIFVIDACANSFYQGLSQTIQGEAAEVRFAVSGEGDRHQQFVLFAAPEYEVAMNDSDLGTGHFSQAVLKELREQSLFPDMKALAERIKADFLTEQKTQPVYWCKVGDDQMERITGKSAKPLQFNHSQRLASSTDWEVYDAVEHIIHRQVEQPFISRLERQEFDDFFKRNSSGLLLITGGAGFGKTALLADWVSRKKQGAYFVAYHFFSQQNDQTRSLAKAYLRLLQQLQKYFNVQIGAVPNDVDSLRTEIYNLIKENSVRFDQPLVIVLDGLEETDSFFSPPFPFPLPDHMFVVASLRVGAATGEKYREWQEAANHTVILKKFSNTEIAQWLTQAGSDTLAKFAEDHRFVARLGDVTQGFPLYLKYLLDELIHVAGQKQDVWQVLDQTPHGFESYVNQQLESGKLDDLDPERWQFFTLLTVAKGTLSAQDVTKITGIENRHLRQFSRDWQITRWLEKRDDQLFAFTHPLLRDIFAEKLGEDVADAIQKLIDYCKDWEHHCSPYALRHFAEHLKQEKCWDDLFLLAHNSRFKEAQRQTFVDEPSLPLKTIQIALQGAIESNNIALIAEFLILHAHQLTETEQESPLQVLRSGNVSYALKLINLNSSIDSFILWALLLAWELKEVGREETVQEILRILQNRLCSFELTGLSSKEVWQRNLAARALAQVFEVDTQVCTALSRRLLGNATFISWSVFIQALCDRGLFSDAIELSKQQESLPDWIRVAELQAQKLSPEAAETTYCEIIQCLEPCSNSFSISWVAGSAANLAKVNYVNLARKIFSWLVEIIGALPTFDSKAEVLLDIVNEQIKAGEVDTSFWQDAFDNLRAININTISDLSVQAGILEKTAKLYAKSNNDTQAKDYFMQALAIIQDVSEMERKQVALRDLAYAQTSVEFEADALETVKQMSNGIDQGNAVDSILSKQIEKNDFQSALRTINIAYLDVDTKARGLQRIAEARAEVGQVEEAIKIARLIPLRWHRDLAWSLIISVQAQSCISSKSDSKSLDDIFATIEQEISGCHQKVQTLLMIVRIQFDQEDFTGAIQTLEKIKHPEDQAEFNKLLAIAHAKADRFEQALNIARNIHHARMQIETLDSIANIRLWTNKAGEARAIYAEMLRRTQQFDLFSLKAVTLLNVADTQIENEQKQAAAATIRWAAENIENVDDLFKRSQLLSFLAQKQFQGGDLETSKKRFEQAISLVEQIQREQGDTLRSSNLFVTIAVSQAEAGDLDAALATAERMNSFQTNSPSSQAKVYLAIANAQKKFGNVASQQRLQKLFADAYENLQQLPMFNFENRDEIFCDLAIAQDRIGDSAEAKDILAHLGQAVQERNDDEANSDRAMRLEHIAIAHIQISEIAAAEAILPEIEIPQRRLRVLWVLASIQYKQNQSIEAVQQFLQLAIQTYAEIQNEKQRVEAVGLLARIQALAGKSQQAIRSAESIPEQKVRLLPALAGIFINTKDIEALKQLIIPCSYHLESAYDLCQALVQLYPNQSSAIAEIVKNSKQG